MIRFTTLTAVLSLGAGLQAQPAQNVGDLVRQLGDSKFAVREAAQRQLAEQGEKIVPELDRLAKNADAETNDRIAKIRYKLVGYKEDIRRLLAEVHDGVGRAPDPVSAELRGLIAAHQPGAGDYLLSMLADPRHKLDRRVIRTFVATWDVATVEQIDAYFRQNVSLVATNRPKYPAKVGAMISFEAQLREGWVSWPMLDSRTFSFNTKTTRYLDGKPYDKPFVYRYPFATVGWYRVGELTEGKHTIHAVMEYEFSQNGNKKKGEFRSKNSTFEVVSADTPDDLIAATSAKTANHVRRAFQVEGIKVSGAGVNAVESPGKGGESMYPPQVSWEASPGVRTGLSCPQWSVAAPLSVDLCMDAEIHDINSGKVFLADPILLTGDATARGYVIPRDPRAFAKGRDGLVPVKIVLKPSRALALSDLRMKRYFPESITVDHLIMKVIPKIEPHAEHK
jgi:hypothetical protein